MTGFACFRHLCCVNRHAKMKATGMSSYLQVWSFWLFGEVIFVHLNSWRIESRSNFLADLLRALSRAKVGIVLGWIESLACWVYTLSSLYSIEAMHPSPSWYVSTTFHSIDFGLNTIALYPIILYQHLWSPTSSTTSDIVAISDTDSTSMRSSACTNSSSTCGSWLWGYRSTTRLPTTFITATALETIWHWLLYNSAFTLTMLRAITACTFSTFKLHRNVTKGSEPVSF